MRRVARSAFSRAPLCASLLLVSHVCAAAVQDPLELLPRNYRLTFENESVRVIHVTYAPMEKLAVHNHSDKPTVYVYLNDSGPVRFSHVEEHPFSLVRPAEKKGAYRFSPGRLEKHAVENLGRVPSEFPRVELRQLPLGYDRSSFRSPKVFDEIHSGVRTEFERPRIRIDRVVAAPGATELKRADAPALLIAFSPALVQSEQDRDAPRSMGCGDVLWIDAGRGARVRGSGDASGHLLRILLPK